MDFLDFLRFDFFGFFFLIFFFYFFWFLLPFFGFLGFFSKLLRLPKPSAGARIKPAWRAVSSNRISDLRKSNCHLVPDPDRSVEQQGAAGQLHYKGVQFHWRCLEALLHLPLSLLPPLSHLQEVFGDHLGRLTVTVRLIRWWLW